MNDDYNRDAGSHYHNADAEISTGLAEAEDMSRTFMNRVYAWMAGGLIITGIVAYLVCTAMMNNVPMIDTTTGAIVNEGSIFWSSKFILFAIIAEFGLVLWLSFGIMKMSPQIAGICFLVYSALTGITLAPVLMAYTQASVYSAFFAAAGTFAATSLFGYLTNRDMSGIGAFCFMGLIGVIIASLVNMFFKNEGVAMILSYVSVVIFTGLTIYDTQKLKLLGRGISEDGEDAAENQNFHRVAIIGALQLYLDFINLFLALLRILGKRR